MLGVEVLLAFLVSLDCEDELLCRRIHPVLHVNPSEDLLESLAKLELPGIWVLSVEVLFDEDFDLFAEGSGLFLDILDSLALELHESVLPQTDELLLGVRFLPDILVDLIGLVDLLPLLVVLAHLQTELLPHLEVAALALLAVLLQVQGVDGLAGRPLLLHAHGRGLRAGHALAHLEAVRGVAARVLGQVLGGQRGRLLLLCRPEVGQTHY